MHALRTYEDKEQKQTKDGREIGDLVNEVTSRKEHTKKSDEEMCELVSGATSLSELYGLILENLNFSFEEVESLANPPSNESADEALASIMRGVIFLRELGLNGCIIGLTPMLDDDRYTTATVTVDVISWVEKKILKAHNLIDEFELPKISVRFFEQRDLNVEEALMTAIPSTYGIRDKARELIQKEMEEQSSTVITASSNQQKEDTD
jgi:hypothetical protein